MRDLTSRLREIVKQPVAGRSEGGAPAGSRVRELTYVPDAAVPSIDVERVAEALGGRRHDVPGSSCVTIDRTWEADAWHGRKRIQEYAPDPAAPLRLFDPRLAAFADWSSRVVFFDIETTGLSGGAGTLALLAGCGWFEHGGAFTIRQFFLSGPAGERALLDGLTEIIGDASLLVTYNGRTFDVPVMDTRWAFHRRESPTAEVPHFDMLGVARRLWGRRAPRTEARDRFAQDEAARSCSLSAIERSVLRFHRVDDVPGLEIPSRYFQFLRTGDPRLIAGVLDHNRHDIVSLAAITGHALRMATAGPEACASGTELRGLGSLYERAGDLVRAEQAYSLAAGADDPEVAVQALASLAVLLRRTRHFDDAAQAWRGVLALADRRPDLQAWARRASEALAIHHEHRARDYEAARHYAQALRSTAAANGRLAAAVDHRIGRLDRKLKKTSEQFGIQRSEFGMDFDA